MPSGEWWIDSCGTAIFADGDIGDINHQAYVIDLVVREVLSHLDIEIGDEMVGTLEGDLVSSIIDGGLLPDGLRYDPDLDEIFDEEGESLGDFYDWVRHEMQSMSYPQEQIDSIYSLVTGRSDARIYGVQYMGMYRVHGNHIQTWTLTHRDLRNIHNGLYDVNNQEDLECLNCVWNIEVSSSKRFYSNISNEDFLSGNPLSIAQYPYHQG